MTDKWSTTMSEGQTWTVEIESDCFTEKDGLVVSLWIEGVDPEENDGKPLYVAQASPAQAREMAAALLKVSDHVERSVLTENGWVER